METTALTPRSLLISKMLIGYDSYNTTENWTDQHKDMHNTALPIYNQLFQTKTLLNWLILILKINGTWTHSNFSPESAHAVYNYWFGYYYSINTKTIKTNIITGKSKVTDNKKEGKKEGKLLTNGSPLRSNPTSSPSLEVWNSSANLTTSPITGSGTFLSIERRNLCKDKKN